MDLVLYTPTNIFLIEFKIDQSAQVAIDQINSRNYSVKFEGDSRKILKVGINISSQIRTIDDWKIEE